MKNQIMDYLQKTSEEYDDNVFMNYWQWCSKYGSSPSRVQELLANAEVNEWWITEFQKLEKKFVDMVNHFPNKIDQLEYHYHGLTVQIFTIYPKPLLDSINKTNKEFISNLIENTPLIYSN